MSVRWTQSSCFLMKNITHWLQICDIFCVCMRECLAISFIRVTNALIITYWAHIPSTRIPTRRQFPICNLFNKGQYRIVFNNIISKLSTTRLRHYFYVFVIIANEFKNQPFGGTLSTIHTNIEMSLSSWYHSMLCRPWSIRPILQVKVIDPPGVIRLSRGS